MKKLYLIIALVLLLSVLLSACGDTKYVVLFETNGGTAVSSQRIAGGGKAAEPLPTPEKDGFVFDGWYKESGLINEWNFDTDTVNSDIILYAKWKDPPKTFKYDVYALYEILNLSEFEKPQEELIKTRDFLEAFLKSGGYEKKSVKIIENKIRIEIDTEEVPSIILDIINNAAKLELKDGDKVIVESKNLESAKYGYSAQNGHIVMLKFDKIGAMAFAEATARLAGTGGTIGIYINGIMVSNPTVNSAITNGEAIIECGFNEWQAIYLADMIFLGKLNVKLSLIETGMF